MYYDQAAFPTRPNPLEPQYSPNLMAPVKGPTGEGFRCGAYTPAPGLLFSDPWHQNRPLMTISGNGPPSNPQRRMALVLTDSAEELREQLCTDTLRDVVHGEHHAPDQSEILRHMKGDIYPLSNTPGIEKNGEFQTIITDTDFPIHPWKGFHQQTDQLELPFQNWPVCEPTIYGSHCIPSRKRKLDNTELNEIQGGWKHRSK